MGRTQVFKLVRDIAADLQEVQDRAHLAQQRIHEFMCVHLHTLYA